MRESGLAVAGLIVSKYSPPVGFTQALPMNRSSLRLCLSSHSIAVTGLSGAGPYSSDSKISATLFMRSGHGMTVERRVASGHEVLELPLDIAEQRAGAKT